MKNFKTVHIIFAFCIGLLFGHLLFPGEKMIRPPSPTELLISKEKVTAIDSTKLLAETALKKRTAYLQNQLQVSSRLLTESKKEVFIQRHKLLLLVQKLKTDTSDYPCKDSSVIDSLVTQVSSLNTATDTLEMAYDKKLLLTESIVAVRDSQLIVCEQSYGQLKDVIKEQALREQQLTEDLNTALKQQKKKRLQNKILAAGMLFISGVVTSLVIKSRQ